MEPNELRIGNFVLYRGDNCRIDLEDFKLMLEYSTGLDSWKPILLSETWLLKFGFEQDDDKEYLLDVYNTDTAFYTFNADFIYNKILFIEGKCALITAELIYNYNVQYVHQLQNLYFALTGEELIYNERKISQRL